MHRFYLLFATVLLMSVLAACGGTTPAEPATSTRPAPTSQAEEPTAEDDEPTPEEEKPTVVDAEPTPEEEPTNTAEQPEEEPTNTPEQPSRSIRALVATEKQIAVVHESGTIHRIDSEGFEGMGPSFRSASASADGALIAMSGENDRGELILLSSNGEMVRQVRAAEGEEFYSRIVFAPDGSQIAYTILRPMFTGWTLNLMELASGESRVIREGSDNNLLTPVAWTADGLFVESILYASDASPRGLALLDPETGDERTRRAEAHITAIPSPDGEKVAIIGGQLTMGGPPQTSLTVLDLTTGEETVLAPLAQGLVQGVRWSPDSAKVTFGVAPDYGQQPASYHIAGPLQTEPIMLSTATLPGQIRDLAWSDPETLRLLLDVEGQLGLYEVTTADIMAAPREIAALQLPSGGQMGDRIIFAGQ